MSVLQRGWPLLLLVCGVARGAEPDSDVHLGVASCAASVCHGKLTPAADREVALNEYRIWTSEDRHSKAYQTLRSDQSKRIARDLGLGSAQAAEVCLDCHADNQPAALRGPKFQISDGVGCEACHGGASRWIETHTETGRAHQDNLTDGMYPTDRPAARARLCLKCHLGTPGQFANHDIMGAGHPRLSFELEAFTANQPPHFIVDADYRRRKDGADGFATWSAGQLQSAVAYLELLESTRYPGAGPFPELALHDCQGCHHRYDVERRNVQRLDAGLTPGGVRLQDQHLLMVEALVAALLPGRREEIASATRQLIRAGSTDVARVPSMASSLRRLLNGMAPKLQALELSNSAAADVRRRLIGFAAAGRMWDFAAAEQTFLAVETLSYVLADTEQIQSALDELFAAVDSDQGYDPRRFSAAARRVQERF